MGVGGDEVRAALGRNIKHFRGCREWSQADLADRAGMSVTFLSALERGAKWPYPDTLYNLASALEITVDELFKPRKTEAAGGQPPSTVQAVIDRFYRDLSQALDKSVSTALEGTLENVYRQHRGRG